MSPVSTGSYLNVRLREDERTKLVDMLPTTTDEAAVGDEASVHAPPVRSFNRFELKYVVDLRGMARLRDDLAKFMLHDKRGDDGKYGVWSLYYDSRGLKSYWEKVDGQRFRRKLRIRHYGSPHELTSTGDVFVEIKQRVDRVTQKRRLVLPHDEAVALCDGGTVTPGRTFDVAGDRIAQEIVGMVAANALRPITIVGYQRSAWVGSGADRGLRVTCDRNVRARDRDLDLSVESANRSIVPPHLAVLEIKANDRVPNWLTTVIARHQLTRVTLSKYCCSIEAFGRTPRSVFHSTVQPTGPSTPPPASASSIQEQS